jgi:CubicO group peptidase (beta-lactamase class C family)
MRLALSLAVAFLLSVAPGAAQQTTPRSADLAVRVDSVFARFTGLNTPGCAVGVTQDGHSVLARAYGSADLEHDVANTPETIFEAGSVSKQFTAAAVVLLAQEGKLSLDDDVRKFIPELPDYGAPITVRHLLNHTSGLRDWGSVAAIGGWPRGTRRYTHAHVLDIVGRQKALNYSPGAYYSYTNTGYNLQAILVERVSGMPFAEFTRVRFFEPLGMTNTQWRDDYTRVVKGRATAYRRLPEGGFRMDMPFENVHGNGGLLTTVADLLRWTENLRTGRVGGPALVQEMHRRGRLTNGREIEYASGLVVTRYRNLPEVSHSGATAGYRAFLARYPDQRLGVALLCNTAHANPSELAHQVAGLYLGETAASAALKISPAEVRPAVLGAYTGLYRETRRMGVLRLDLQDGVLRIENGSPLVPLSSSQFQAGNGTRIHFDSGPGTGVRVGFWSIAPAGDSIRYEPVPAFMPTPAQSAEYVGTYRSNEAETSYTVALEHGRLTLRSRGGGAIPLTPLYLDVFSAGSGLFRFTRDHSGRVTQMHASSDRVWSLPFERQP